MGVSVLKIGVISDLHFGYARNTERSEDCWEAAEEAFRKAECCDLIILPGDIFDDKIPRPEDWAKSMKILSRVKVPVVAIHGTHERRGKGLINCVEGLEHAGFLKHLHCSHASYEIKGKKITVYGMSGVPEAYAKEVLQQWNPRPQEGYNIFMLHQSIHPYIYNPIEPPSLKLEDLPKGFDLYISGHIHWSEKTKVMGKPFIIPGSTVTTQVNKTEAKSPKGFYIVELMNNAEVIRFVELENVRKVFYNDFKLDSELSDVMEKIDDYLGGIKEKKKPLVRVRVSGKMGKGTDLNFSHLKEKYRDKMILSISSRVSEEELASKLKLLKNIRESRISVEEMGLRILRENMKELDLSQDYEGILDLLVDGNVDSAMVHLLANSETKGYESKEQEEEPELKEEPEEIEKEQQEDAGEQEEIKEFFEKKKEKREQKRRNLFDWSS